MEVKGNERMEQLNPISPGDESSCQLNEDSQDLMELYEDPNVYDVLIANLADVKTKPESACTFELTYKIKTMRLLNNEIKMVYNQNGNAEFDGGDHEEDEEDDIQLLKLNDDRYHEKIRAAINTKLSHEEVRSLKYIGMVVAFLFVGATILQMIFGLALLENFSIRAE